MTTQQKQYIDNSLIKSLKDPLIISGFIFAPIFWLVLYFVSPPADDRTWLLFAPIWYFKLVFIFPILEEMVFRGLVQTTIFGFLRKIKLGPLTLSNIIASFAYFSFNAMNNVPMWLGMILIPSLFFGYLKDKYHTLKQPILMHAYFNAGFFLIFPPVSSL